MYVRRLAGSGMARNFVSHSRSVWLERGGDPASEGGSAASKEDGSSRQKTNNTAAERRIEFLSKGIGSLIIDGRSGISIRCFSLRSPRVSQSPLRLCSRAGKND